MNKPVRFNISKLLKEKGFDDETKYGHNGAYEPHHLNLIEFGYPQRNSELYELVYSAPIIMDVVMWICENHKIWIAVTNVNHEGERGWCFDIHTLPVGIPKMWKRGDEIYKSPTESYEAGIEYVLKNLI